MKTINRLFKYAPALACLLILLMPAVPQAAMKDYCSVPPFIGASFVKPNLLLMIDNSGSMYDLSYVDDRSFGRCSGTTGDTCVTDSDCPPGEKCELAAAYCYDQTYVNSNTYAGYFETEVIYVYSGGHFIEAPVQAVPGPASCTHVFPDTLCVNIVAGDPKTVDQFVAKGNYLNWLTSSKFDVEKEILTGGKYDTTADEYLSESRGCVGRGFIKEALVGDYVEPPSTCSDSGGACNSASDCPPGEECGTDSLGIVFTIEGEPNENNPDSGVSWGGQTYINIYEGDYSQAECQEAIQAIVDANNPSAIRKAVEDCLSYDPNAGDSVCALDSDRSCSVDSDCVDVGEEGKCTSDKGVKTCTEPLSMFGESCQNNNDCDTEGIDWGPCEGTEKSAVVNTKIAFNQSMQECWQYWSKGTPPGHDAWTGESQKCEEIYAGYRECVGGDDDGKICTDDTDCAVGGTCEGGPDVIYGGNAALMCGRDFTGYCATNPALDDWATTVWVSREYADAETCFRAKYLEFCEAVPRPPVTDPSDAPSNPAETGGVPAIIADVGVEAQLGEAIGTFTVKRYETTAPTGLLNTYNDLIRFGAMSFNFDGSDFECDNLVLDPDGDDALSCPKFCSNDADVQCTSVEDCPEGVGVTCDKIMDNKDASTIIHYIGDDGYCEINTATACDEDSDCPDFLTLGEVCNLVGDHDTGLISSIDDLPARSWTPFAEAMYNAIAYFVKDARATNPALPDPEFTPTVDAIQEPIDTTIESSKNPIISRCQFNNVLLISDGASTADIENTLTSKVSGANFNDGDNIDSETCSLYYGSTYLDDLSYFAYNRNIFDPSQPFNESTANTAQRIRTHVVYTGTEESTETGECAPMSLMQSAASNSETDMQYPRSPEELETALSEAFDGIASVAASGTAASVLTTSSRGAGSVLQAYFLPVEIEEGRSVQWVGYMQNIWLDEDGNLREDTNEDLYLQSKNSTADSNDMVIKLYFNEETDKAEAGLFTVDDDGDSGTLASCSSPVVKEMTEVSSLWKAGEKLALMDPAARQIYTANRVVRGSSAVVNKAGPVLFDYDEPVFMGDSDYTDPLNADGEYSEENIIRYIRGECLETGVSGSTDCGDYNQACYVTGVGTLCGNEEDCPVEGEACVTFGVCSEGVPTEKCLQDSDCDNSAGGEKCVTFRDRRLDADGDGVFDVWKLGDIVSSTPKVFGGSAVNTYLIDYGDLTYWKYVSDRDRVAGQPLYKEKSSIAFVGANDGMLHAFRVGYLKDDKFTDFPDPYADAEAKFQNSPTDSGTDKLGEEVWAYVPYNALPYLKYFADPDYCHIYYADLTVRLMDVSIDTDSVGGNSMFFYDQSGVTGKDWATLLIGGMRFGGACGTGGTPAQPPVVTPTEVGFSSYFAIDVTDPENPVPLWEFSDDDLGYAASYPTVVRTGSRTVNGSWYMIVGTGSKQLPKQSRDMDRPAGSGGKLYVINLLDGTVVKEIDLGHDAIVGDILSIDKDKDYHAEKIYFGTSYKSGAAWNGKIMSLAIPDQDLSLMWPSETPVTLFEDAYPFTASPEASKDHRNRVWVYAGSGKYVSSLDELDTSQQIFIGFKDNAAQVALADLENTTSVDTTGTVSSTRQICTYDPDTGFGFKDIVTSITPSSLPVAVDEEGWLVYLSEREKAISRPVAVGGLVDFVTYVPNADECEAGGSSYLYSLGYTTGVASKNVSIRSPDATSGTEGDVTVYKRVLLGEGAPPQGEAIIIPPCEGAECDNIKKKIQIATGVIIEAENDPAISILSKVMHWLKK